MATVRLYGQAQAFLNHPHLSAQAQARIKATTRFIGQARAVIAKVSLKGQAQAVIRTPRIYLQDHFTRFASSTWGTPEIGPTYTYNDSDAAFNVDGSFGTINNLTDFTPEAVSAIDAFNQNIFIKFRKINIANTTIEIISRNTDTDISFARDTISLDIQNGSDTSIQFTTEFSDTPPRIITDNDIVWRVQDIFLNGWSAGFEFVSEDVGVILGLFTGDRFWYLSTAGTTGLVEPNWSDPQPIVDGTAEWTEIVPATWTSATGYTAGDYVIPVVFNGNLYRADNSGTSDSTEPAPWPFDDSFNDFSNIDGNIFWQGDDFYDTIWNALQAYELKDVGFFGGIYWEVTTAGTSDSVEPNWADPSPITDGTVEWTEIPAWTTLTAFGQDALVVPTVDNGYFYRAYRAGTTGATQPSPWAVLVEHSFDDGNDTTSPIQGIEGVDSTIFYLKAEYLDDTVQVKFWSSDFEEPASYDLIFNPLLTVDAGDFELRISDMGVSNEILPYYVAVDEINIDDPTVLAGRMVAQAAARIRNPNTKLSGQAQALIRKSQLYAQAQASITDITKLSGQARAFINNPLTPTVPVIITGSGSISAGVISQSDIADLGLPGYLQEEVLISDMQIEQFGTPYSDGSRSDYTGLSNKELTIVMRIWDIDWATCKTRLELAATMLRARRDGPLNLFLYESDKYYQVWVKEIRYEKSVPESQRFLDYQVVFEARPWLESITENTITTVGDVSTVGRTYDDGGWTPINLIVSGTNVSIVGTTDDGTDAGTITIPGSVTNLEINTETGVAVLNYVIRNDLLNADFGLYVGPGVTNYVITGASNVIMTYRHRWYL